MPQQHSQAHNLYAQLIRVRAVLSELVSETSPYWTNLEIYSSLNAGQQYIARKAKCLIKTVQVTTVASTQEYDLKDNSFSDIIDISKEGVYFNKNGTSNQKLFFTTKERLDSRNAGWRDVSASVPQEYYYDKSSKTIGLYPKPNSSNAGAYLNIEGIYKPAILHAGTADAASLVTQLVLPAGSATLPYPSVVDDYYNNVWVEVYSGTSAGEKVKITDYTGATRIALAAFTTAPDNTSIYGMVPQIPEEAHYLMEWYALGDNWGKGGSRTSLGQFYWNKFLNGLSLFIGEFEDDEDETLQKEPYR